MMIEKLKLEVENGNKSKEEAVKRTMAMQWRVEGVKVK